MITQLNSPIPVITPKGKALAFFIIDYGIEHDLQWICIQDGTGESWTWANPLIRAQKNITQGRDYISPFYEPDDVAFTKKEDFESLYNSTYQEKMELQCELEELAQEYKKEKDLLLDSKIHLEKICRDQLDEIQGLHETMESMARGDQKYSLNEKLVNQLIKSNKKLGDHARHLERQVYQLRKFFDNPKLEEDETSLQKQIKEAKRLSETPNFADLVKPPASIVDEDFQKKIEQVTAELRGKEIQILDDFCKAYYAAESHMTGRDLIGIIGKISLNIQTFIKDGQMGTRYWFSPKEAENV